MSDCAVFIAVLDVDSASVEDSREVASFSGDDGDSSVEEEEVVEARERVEVRNSKSVSTPKWVRVVNRAVMLPINRIFSFLQKVQSSPSAPPDLETIYPKLTTAFWHTRH